MILAVPPAVWWAPNVVRRLDSRVIRRSLQIGSSPRPDSIIGSGLFGPYPDQAETQLRQTSCYFKRNN